MKVVQTAIPGLVVVEPDLHRDDRGWFLETWHEARYASEGLAVSFVQDNHSHSTHGVLRGLHYQLERPQAKLVSVVAGTIFDVAVDIRRGSPTFRRWVGMELSAENRRQVFVPPGFAHGFAVLSSSADVTYKCTDFYVPGDQHGILWDDPDIAIAWPQIDYTMSERDAANPRISEIEHLLPVAGSGSVG